ncbi:MAG: tetratricopeptide repeat protein [Thermoanaerobaculia bacterium]|nr:tetratricopeptide repeat protein [Thermoanaerobaculia bacterium]
MPRPLRAVLPSLFVLGCLVAAPLLAQQTALLRGTVTDRDETPLEGATITITCNDLPRFQQVERSDKDGEFVARFRLPQYTYQLLFERTGYQSFTQDFKPSLMERKKETYVMDPAETQVIERHGDLQSIVTGSSNEAVETFNAGLTAQREGDLSEAKANFQAALEADPDLGPAHLALAQVSFDLNEYDQAIASADRARALNVPEADALRIKYQALRSLGRRDEAEAIADQLESAEGKLVAARGMYNDAAEAFQAQDLDTALEKFQKAAEMDPTLHEAHHAIAVIQHGKGQHEAAVQAAQTALELGSEDVRTLRVLYDAYDALGKMDQLADIAPRLAKVDPDFGGPKLVEQAANLWNAGQTDKAVQVSQLALSIDPSLAKPHYFLGLSHISSGNNAEAKAALQKFLEMAPDDPEAPTAREMLSYIE